MIQNQVFPLWQDPTGNVMWSPTQQAPPREAKVIHSDPTQNASTSETVSGLNQNATVCYCGDTGLEVKGMLMKS